MATAAGGRIGNMGMMNTAVGIVRHEGFFNLWQGLTPALYRHMVYSGCRMSFYEFLREKVFVKEKDGSFALYKATLCGLTAGAMAQFLANPTDLVKVQMQMEGKRRLQGLPPRFYYLLKILTNIINLSFRFVGVPGAVLRIVRDGGSLRALWTGWAANVQRAALVNMGGKFFLLHFLCLSSISVH